MNEHLSGKTKFWRYLICSVLPILENTDRKHMPFHLSFNIRHCWIVKPNILCNIVTGLKQARHASRRVIFFLWNRWAKLIKNPSGNFLESPWLKSVQDNRKQRAATEGETRILLRLSTRKSSSGFICTLKETDTKIPISQAERSELFLLILTDGAYASSESVCSVQSEIHNLPSEDERNNGPRTICQLSRRSLAVWMSEWVNRDEILCQVRPVISFW